MRSLLQFNERFWNDSLLVLANMESVGLCLDTEYLSKKHALALEQIAELELSLERWTADYTRQTEQPINWNSPKQVNEFLYVFKNFPPPKVIGSLKAPKQNRKRAHSSSQAALNWLAGNTSSDSERSYLRTLLEMNQTGTLAGFMAGLPSHLSADGRLRSSLGPGADTGRLTSSHPNLQNIPIHNDRFGIRGAFMARRGHVLVVADYSQLEMYVLAHFLLYVLGDDSLANDLASGDVHTNTAFRLWGDQLAALGATPENIKEHEHTKLFRSNAKTVNYAIPYGKTAVGLGQQICDVHGKPIGKAAAQGVLDQYFESYPGLGELFERWKGEARQTGYVRTLLGRTRPLPDAASDDKWSRIPAERQAVNTPVQGSAADIVTTAMLRCNTAKAPGLVQRGWFNKELHDLGAKLALQIHDELIFEVPAEHGEVACAIIKHTMENCFEKPLLVPLKVDANVGRTWADGK